MSSVTDLIGSVIPYGVGVALSPLPVIATVLLLMAPVGLRGAWAFLAARVLGLAALVTVFAFAIDLIDAAAGSSIPAAIAQLVIGSGLIVFAFVKWRSRPRGEEDPPLPAWMRGIDSASAPKAFTFGLILTVANLKEIAFAAGVGVSIGAAAGEVGVGAGIWAGLIFLVLACASIAVPTIAVASLGPAIAPRLAQARAWLVHNQPIVIAVVLLVVGSLLIGSGIAEF